MDIHALRLRPGQDLKEEIRQYSADHAIQAGCILTGIGSLTTASLRFAGQAATTLQEGPFEILSLSGTLGREGVHLHIALSDREGRVTGGHLMDGCIIYTTAEIVIGELGGLVFRRKTDKQTGHKELHIEILRA